VARPGIGSPPPVLNCAASRSVRCSACPRARLPWPPPGRSGAHQRAVLMTASGQFLISLDKRQAQGAQLLWRASATFTLPVLELLPDGSYLSRLLPGKGTRLHRAGTGPVTVRVVECAINDGRAPPEPAPDGPDLQPGPHRASCWDQSELTQAKGQGAGEMANNASAMWEVMRTRTGRPITPRPARPTPSPSKHPPSRARLTAPTGALPLAPGILDLTRLLRRSPRNHAVGRTQDRSFLLQVRRQ
jgi:hypothetical protein